ncbi:sulfotransferase domain-containing protein [Croceicoccus pelagius]|uniref:Sulfotransferase domain-containing protein n=1 Tax=Croceicoccus pelagius TaxID=1703341 RepID=A0A917DER3_9SPHN|nr:sulfotransferase domain-containing protein [Croceicoccus pelagius]GGD30935.1 hypothetical protein GCM10010989_01330 [Croceicoccus pelagius]
MLRKIPRVRRDPVANDPRVSDLYVVEYPKSGVTWLCTLLGNLAALESGSKAVVNYTNSIAWVPDIHISRNIGEPLHSWPPQRMIKSHARFQREYTFALYLARHPVAVMKSYYRYAAAFQGAQFEDFGAFLRSEKYGVDTWRDHVRSWLGRRPSHHRILLVRYEDLLDDAAAQLMRISDVFGWNVDADHARIAAQRSSADNMQANEGALGIGGPKFVKQASTASVTEADLAFIHERCAEEMAMLGYDPLASGA